MTKQDIVKLNMALGGLGQLQGVKFAYAVSRNVSLIKPELESLENASKATPEYAEFEKKRIELVEKFAKKDDKGKPILINNVYDIEDDKKEEMEKEFEVLKSENQEVYDAREKQVNEYNELLKTESTVVLHKIAISEVPQNITVAQLHSISEIIVDEIPTPYK